MKLESVHDHRAHVTCRRKWPKSGERGWLVNFKFPPGLSSGWHEASVRVRDSQWSNAVRIGLDPVYAEESSGELAIIGAADNNTWEHLRVRTGPGSCLAVWIRGVDSLNASREDFEIRLSGSTLPAIFASAPDAEGIVQINARVPSGLAPGPWNLQVRFRTVLSKAIKIELV